MTRMPSVPPPLSPLERAGAWPIPFWHSPPPSGGGEAGRGSRWTPVYASG